MGTTENNEMLRAVEQGDVARVRQLLDGDASLVNCRTAGSDETPLHLAASFGHLDIARLLLDRGADVNAEAFYHDTPMTLALRTKHAEIAQLLKDGGGEEYP